MTHNPPRVAVVDDNAMIRRMLSIVIGTMGLGVRTFGSAEEFVLEADTEPDACLLLDVNLPGQSGLSLQAYLNASGSRVPVIMLTASIDPQVREKALAQGALDVLAKPVPPDRLRAAIRSAVGQTG